MSKVFIKFIISCLILTLVVFSVLFYVNQKIDFKNTQMIAGQNVRGKFFFLYDYLKQFPENQWQTKVDQIKPPYANEINIVPMDQLRLPQTQKERLINHGIVFIPSKNPENQDLVYQRIDETNLVFQEKMGFSYNELAHRFFGWQPLFILNMLNILPKNKWDEFLKSASAQYGYNIRVLPIDDPILNSNERKQLLENNWVVVWPNQTNRALEIVYIPFDTNYVLKFGPIKYPFYETYQTYILFIIGLLIIEFIIFLIAMLYIRSIDKLKLMADDYSQGNFASKVNLKNTSTLYPLFTHLKMMGSKIKYLMESQKELVHAISHELRTPLSRIKFSLESLKKNEKLKPALVSIQEDVRELEELVSQILDYSKLSNIEKLNLNKVKISQIIDKIINKSKNKSLFINKINSNNDIIYADELYITRALQNILQNAERFAKSRVIISLETSDHTRNIIIEDDGPGIPEEERTRVFEPFVQINPATEKFYGLGLAIVKKIIEQHGFEIKLGDSTLGGAKFTIVVQNNFAY